MKLLRYNWLSESTHSTRLGVLLSGDRVGDLRAGYARYLNDECQDPLGKQIAEQRIPRMMVDFLAIGSTAMEAARLTLAFLERQPAGALGPDGEPLAIPIAQARLHSPLKPSKVIAVGRNYRDHLKETGHNLPGKVPSAWIKAASTIMGPHRDIIKPRATRKLDYETELALVIGRRCKNVPAEKALDVLAGYTVLNDITARDIVYLERAEGNQLLGKMFDTFAPVGPWLVTTDEVPDPMNLKVRTRVNGEVRQDGNTADMIWNIPQLIAYTSQMTLEAGDIIATGTPSGVAAGRKDGEKPWFLNAGDVLESEVEGVGMLRNKIVDEAETSASWQW